MSGHDDRREVEALEAELRADRCKDPGDAFFADLEQRILRDLPLRPAPRRPWWHPAAVWQWGWQPAPVAALAGAAVVALVVWGFGPGGPSEDWTLSLRKAAPKNGANVHWAARPLPNSRVTSGEAWFARLPPTEDLWALEDADLPALLALVSAGDPAEEEELSVIPLGESADEQSLNGLTEEQLRGLAKELDQKLDKNKPRPKAAPRGPGPPQGKAG